MDLSSIGLVLVTIIFVWYRRKTTKEKELNRRNGLKEIPGPKGLPIIGNLHQLKGDPNLQSGVRNLMAFTKLIWELTCKTIPQRFIVVSNPKWTKEIFSENAFSGRPHSPVFYIYEEHPKLGVISADGERWEQTRRFLLRQLRDFGFGKSAMETRIMDEVNEVISIYKSMEGKPVGNIKNKLRLAMVNSLWTILTSKRFSHDDPKLLYLSMNISDTFNEVMQGGALLGMLPWLKYIAPKLSGYNKVRKMYEENKEFFQETIDEHKRNLNLKDFMDVYLAEIKPQWDFY